jgi:hypothetical protein
LIACLVIAIPAAISLIRLFGDRVLMAAMVIGLFSLTIFALLQLVPLPVPISSELQIRA